jgi:hypothetical protein
LGSCDFEYSCAKAAHTFLCVLKCAFWHSLSQYVTLWHLRQSLGALGVLAHCAHWAVGDVDVDDDEGSAIGSSEAEEVVAVSTLGGSDGSAMASGTVLNLWEKMGI